MLNIIIREAYPQCVLYMSLARVCCDVLRVNISQVNSGEIVVLDTQMNDISIQRFVDENSATFFYDEVTPGGNFNDVIITRVLLTG